MRVPRFVKEYANWLIQEGRDKEKIDKIVNFLDYRLITVNEAMQLLTQC